MDTLALDFQKIYADFRPLIQRYLARLVGEFEAEDLTQEVFVRVNQALPTFRGEAQVKTWIYRIATNLAVDRMRSPSFKAPASLDVPAEVAGDIEAIEQDLWSGEKSPSPEQQVFQQQRFACYCDYIKQMPEIYRLVVLLNQLGEYTAQEIADLLGLSLETVKMRLQRGKNRLLSELRAHCRADDWL